MIRENREYRNMPCMNIRAREGLEETKSFVVEGYASTFDEYVLFESEGIQYKEKIVPEAFEDCDMSDVVFLKDHEGCVFARTRNKTIDLSVDSHGLKVRADLGKTGSARNVFEEIDAGMYDQMSFAFIVDDDEYDARSHTRIIRHIKKLFDVSVVSFPANGFTNIDVATRSRFDGFIEAEKAELLERERKEKLEMRKQELLKRLTGKEVEDGTV